MEGPLTEPGKSWPQECHEKNNQQTGNHLTPRQASTDASSSAPIDAWLARNIKGNSWSEYLRFRRQMIDGANTADLNSPFGTNASFQRSPAALLTTDTEEGLLSLDRALKEQEHLSQLQTLQILQATASYRDNDTGPHAIRVGHYARCLALAAGLGAEAAEALRHTAPLHDIGKIGICDAIRLKPGRLSVEELIAMREHTIIGAKIFGERPQGLLRTAAVIALHHHEKWNGSGYPEGLSGLEIPIEARIVAFADVFDFLTWARPYKPAWPTGRAFAHIEAESGQQFDPNLVEAFMKCVPEILTIRKRWTKETPWHA